MKTSLDKRKALKGHLGANPDNIERNMLGEYEVRGKLYQVLNKAEADAELEEAKKIANLERGMDDYYDYLETSGGSEKNAHRGRGFWIAHDGTEHKVDGFYIYYTGPAQPKRDLDSGSKKAIQEISCKITYTENYKVSITTCGRYAYFKHNIPTNKNIGFMCAYDGEIISYEGSEPRCPTEVIEELKCRGADISYLKKV